MKQIELNLNNPADLAEAKRLLSGRGGCAQRPVDSTPAPSGRHWCLALPRHTALVNALLHSVKARIARKRADRELVAEWAANAGIPAATGKRRVRLTIVLAPRQRAGDPDAYQKSLGDALVQCGLLVNDSRQWVEWVPPQFARGELARMFVELEDV